EAESTEPLAPDGFLGLASLPKALLVGKLALDGKLILPDANGPRTATFTVTSGGIAPNTESVIEAVVLAPAASSDSAAGETRLTIKLRQSSTGEVTAASVHAVVKAQMPEQPPVELTATAELHKANGHEAWSVRILPESARDPLLTANGTFDPATQQFSGRAELAAAAAILAPWLPADLPVLAASGEATLAFNLNTLDWDI